MNHSWNNGDVELIDERLASLRNIVPNTMVEARLRQHMRKQWQSTDARQRPSWLWFRCLPDVSPRTLSLCGASVVILVAASMLYMAFSPRSVYAQVIAAVRTAQTIFAKGVQYRHGQEVNSTEIWYDADRGVREQLGKTRMRIDNRVFEWVYYADTNTAIKGPSRDPVGQIEELLRPVEALDRLKAEHDSALDANIEGSECRAFVAVQGEALRIVSWLDNRNRLVRFEEQRKVAENWELDERIDLRYDATIPNDRFAPVFPKEAQVIERTARLDDFSLEKALATAERLGIVLAIHDVRRVDEDTVFVLSTSRSSQGVIDRVGQIDTKQNPFKIYGEFIWGSNGRRMADHSWVDGMNPMVLADWRRDGIDFQWVLLRNTKAWMQADNKLPVGFHVYARDEWEEALKADKKPIHLWNELDVAKLKVPEESEGLSSVLAKVYKQTSAMGDATLQSGPNLHLKSVPFTKKEIDDAVTAGTPRAEAEKLLHGRISQPENISLDAWQAEVLLMIGPTPNHRPL
jgi:hypothetical protein